MLKMILPVSVIIALRFLGLFIVLPLLSVYAINLKDANEVLVGATIGIYAISQMTMQIPFGALSDKIGRKETLLIGSIIFIAGSLVCAYSESIYTLLFGRFLQGMGAVGAVGAALISDLVSEEKRAKAMAFMGVIIALSFALSMLLGPIIGGIFGLNTLFLLTAALSVLSLFLLFAIPKTPQIKTFKSGEKVNYKKILTDKNLARMNITNFLQKALMTLFFMSVPIVMIKNFAWEKSELWHIYAPSMIFGLLAMMPSVILGEKKKKSKEMLCVGIVLFIIAFLIMGYAKDKSVFIIGAILFFVGFNIHEPLMQSLASKYAKVKERGATFGIFNFFGYFGAFLGGIVGGIFLKTGDLKHISWAVFIICTLWLILIKTLKNPSHFQNIYLQLSEIDASKLQILNSLDGIVEHYTSGDTLTIKFDMEIINKKEIDNFLK